MSGLNVMVVGAGAMGFNHVRVYAELKDVERVVVVDSNPAALDKVREHKFDNAVLHTNLADALKTEKIDAASVAAPTPHHHAVAKQLLEAGVDVLVEKPICETVADARELIALAKAKNAVLMVGQIERFNPAVQALKKALPVIGELVYASAHRFGIPTNRDLAKSFYDQAVHDIDVLSFLSGEYPERVQAVEQKRLDKKTEDLCSAIYEFPSFVATVEANRVTPIKTRELIVLGTKGSAKLDYITQELTVTKADEAVSKFSSFDEIVMRVGRGTELRPYFPKQEPLRVELEHFVHCVRKRETPLVTGEDGMRALAAVLAGIHSAKTGKKEKIAV